MYILVSVSIVPIVYSIDCNSIYYDEAIVYFNWSDIFTLGLETEYNVQVFLLGTNKLVFNETTQNNNITFNQNQLQDNTKYLIFSLIN